MAGLDQGELDAASSADGGGPPRRRRVALGAALVVLAGLGLGLGLSLGGGASAPPGPEGVPLLQVPDLAPASTTLSGTPIDGITCRTSQEQKVKYHIHVHLAVYVNGNQKRIPAGAGIPAPNFPEHLADGLFIDNSATGGCLYWLHVHADDGIIHVEAPYKGVFTLGQFFDVWGQPLGPDQVGPARGAVTAFENGTIFRGNPSDIALLPHAVVQLDVGTPVVPYQPVSFNVTGACGAGTEGCASSGG